MGITYETPEEKQALINGIKKDLAVKHNIENTDGNTLLDELAKTEFTRRETQASYTKGRQTLKELEAEKQFLMSEVQKGLNLSTVQNEELNKLKFEDPDKWRDTVHKLEVQAKEDFDKTITNGLGQAKSEASKNYELSRREEILKDFSEANPGFNLTDEKVLAQLPPVLVNQLANNEITFEDFLTKAQKFEVATKVTSTKVPNSGSDTLDKTSGGQEPSNTDVKKSVAEDYESIVL